MNRDVRDRLLLPLGIPLLAVLIIAPLVWSFSRLLLRASEEIGKEEAAFVAIVAALAILLGSAFASSYRRVPLASFAPIAMLLFVAIIGGGIGAAVTGGEGAHGAGEGGEGGGGGTPVATVQISANNLAFDKDTLTLPAGVLVGIEFNNQEAVQHNVAVYNDSSLSQVIFQGDVFSGPRTRLYTFTSPAQPGNYYFRCDLHPNMQGTLVIQ